MAICSILNCVLPQNAVRFDAKRSPFWCILQLVLVHIAVGFAAYLPHTGERYSYIFVLLRVQSGRLFSTKRDAMLYEIAKNGRENVLERCAKLIISAHFICVFTSFSSRRWCHKEYVL